MTLSDPDSIHLKKITSCISAWSIPRKTIHENSAEINNNVIAENITVFDFTKDEFKTLKVGKKYKGETTWTLGTNENGNFIKAEAQGKGSGLGKEILIDLLKTPFINITWKVEKDLSGIVENSKKGHDYAARVFVIKKTGRIIHQLNISNSSISLP